MKYLKIVLVFVILVLFSLSSYALVLPVKEIVYQYGFYETNYTDTVNFLSGIKLTTNYTNLVILNSTPKVSSPVMNATKIYVVNSSYHIICKWDSNTQTYCLLPYKGDYNLYYGSDGSNYTRAFSSAKITPPPYFPNQSNTLVWVAGTDATTSNYSIGALLASAGYGTSYTESVYSATISYNYSFTTNLSSNVSTNFSVLFNITDPFQQPKTCGIETNNTNLFCFNQTTSTNTTVVSCNFVQDIDADVRLISWCNDSTRIRNSNLTNLINILDSSFPTITYDFVNNSHHSLYNITGSFNFSDSNLFRWNVSIDGNTIDSAFNVSYTNYQYNLTKSPALFPVGMHTLFVEVTDGHTAEEIKEYDVDNGFIFKNDISFNTLNNYISIENDDKSLFDVFTYEKEKDRYKFRFTPNPEGIKKTVMVNDKEYKVLRFNVETEKEIFVVKNVNTEYKTWIVTGNNWIDFYNNSILNDKTLITVDEKNNKKAVVEIFYPTDMKDISFSSVGDLNIFNLSFNFYSAVVTFNNPTSVNKGEIISHSSTIIFTGTNYTYTNFSGTFYYNNTQKTVTKTSDSTHVYLNTTFQAFNTNHTNLSFYWNISLNNQTYRVYYGNQTINPNSLSQNCSIPDSVVALRFCGKDEVSLNNISNMSLNLNLEVLENNVITSNYGFIFSNSSCYDICISPANSSMNVNGKLEYGKDEYTDRKYYLLDTNLSKISTNITLFHLPTNVSSDVILTVFNKNNGDKIKDAFIKILRYYPGNNNATNSLYQTVEIEKTDQNGETLGKFVLADVWYKFIVEYPAGTVVLDSDIQKIITVEKLIPVSLSQGNLQTFKTLLDVNGDVSCDKSTNTCRFTWSNPTNTEVTGTLKIFQDTGFSKILVYNESTSSAAATIAYTIQGNVSGKKYVAEGWIDP